MASAATEKVLGTLIVVVLKARNLPNKRHIGKQDPYCTVTMNGTSKRTKAVKRGGQHPEWDEEIRFPVLEDVDDILAKTKSREDEDVPEPPPKDATPKKEKAPKVKGGKSLRIQVFADDPREPEFIGEGTVELDTVMSKGEQDDWYTITNKDRYQGEVYLEMTYWLNEKPPPKKNKAPASILNVSTGSGSGIDPVDLPASLRAGGPASVSAGSVNGISGRPRVASDATTVQSLRQSGSLASLELYQAPYEGGPSTAPRLPTPRRDAVIDEYDEFGGAATDLRRPDTMPVRGQRPVTMYDISSSHSLSSHHVPRPSMAQLSSYDSTSSISDSLSSLSLATSMPGHGNLSRSHSPLPRPHSQSFSAGQVPQMPQPGMNSQDSWSMPTPRNSLQSLQPPMPPGQDISRGWTPTSFGPPANLGQSSSMQFPSFPSTTPMPRPSLSPSPQPYAYQKQQETHPPTEQYVLPLQGQSTGLWPPVPTPLPGTQQSYGQSPPHPTLPAPVPPPPGSTSAQGQSTGLWPPVPTPLPGAQQSYGQPPHPTLPAPVPLPPGSASAQGQSTGLWPPVPTPLPGAQQSYGQPPPHPTLPAPVPSPPGSASTQGQSTSLWPPVPTPLPGTQQFYGQSPPHPTLPAPVPSPPRSASARPLPPNPQQRQNSQRGSPAVSNSVVETLKSMPAVIKDLQGRIELLEKRVERRDRRIAELEQELADVPRRIG